jgi:hypothetical protein
MALKTGAELMDAFLFLLRVFDFEQGKKGGERVRNQGGVVMVFKNLYQNPCNRTWNPCSQRGSAQAHP